MQNLQRKFKKTHKISGSRGRDCLLTGEAAGRRQGGAFRSGGRLRLWGPGSSGYSNESRKKTTHGRARKKTSHGMPLEIKLEPLWPIWLMDRRAWKKNQTRL